MNAAAIYRPLGRTGLQVSEIGLGAWQLGNVLWGSADAGDAVRIVHAALANGCNFFDTAPGYAAGRSEDLLGLALLGRRERVVLCSKFGHPADGPENFSVAALRPSIEASLRRLRTDYIDVVLLHNPPADLLRGDGALALQAGLAALKQEGKLRAFGASVDWSRDLRAVTAMPSCQAAEVLFNIFHQEPAAAFPKAAARGVGLIVKVPLDSGWLSGGYNRASSFSGVRSRWTPAVIERRARLVEMVRALLPPGASLPQAALAFVLSHPEVSTVIPGAKSVTQVEANLAAAQLRLPAATLAALRQLWEVELRHEPLPW